MIKHVVFCLKGDIYRLKKLAKRRNDDRKSSSRIYGTFLQILVSTARHELHFEGTELMQLQFFYGTSHFTLLVHHALIPFSLSPL